MEKKFNEKFNNLLLNKNANAVFLNKVKYDELILKMNNMKTKITKKTVDDYKLIKKYDVINISGIEKLVVPVSEGNLIKYYVYNEQLFQLLNEIHISVVHGSTGT
jgi:hypothetical protein